MTDLEIANRVVKAMAHSRERFKEKLTEYIGGALGEFYKARLAEKNGCVQWVDHWKIEVTNLLHECNKTLKESIRGFKDRQKPLDEVIEEFKSVDSSYRHIAYNEVIRDFEISRLKFKLTDRDTKEFFDRVRQETHYILKGQ
jgi:hypothetical protein